MEAVFTTALTVGVVLWVAAGFFSRRMDRREEKEERVIQGFYDSLQENREADSMLRDPDHVKRLQDEFN